MSEFSASVSLWIVPSADNEIGEATMTEEEADRPIYK